jgi:hypothetical protein
MTERTGLTRLGDLEIGARGILNGCTARAPLPVFRWGVAVAVLLSYCMSRSA